ncbi:MAG: exo-alpha-sialidase, partial [Candidatus Latescibacteria bacterium]|nr:exo-alpha-sialidase [Candidatus Latescibacterota bacterium]
MSVLAESLRQKVSQLLGTLIHQERARIVVPTYGQESGFWFGGGNLAQDESGTIWLSGRYRNVGDSRTGLEAGQRGLECAIFRSDDGGHTFTKVSFWTKSDLSVAERIISYEGTALYQRTDGIWELFISSEK